jgi:hypothetical protein
MSFNKSIKSLRMLSEAPLPPNFDPQTILPSKAYYGGRYERSVPDIRDRFDTPKNKKKFGVEQLGKVGSSRVTYRLNVPASAFSDKSVLRKFKIDLKGDVPTAIKIALNEQGIAQNKAEISTFKDHSSYLFVPLLDTSYENKRRTIEVNGQVLPPEESNWLQFLFVNNYPSETIWRKDINSYFGYPVDETISKRWFGHLPFLEYALDKGYYSMEFDPNAMFGGKPWRVPFDKNQRKNIEEFVSLGKQGLILNDLTFKNNWGYLGNRPYILDYGFDGNTVGLYRHGKDALDGLAAIDSDGVISLEIRKSQ